jgi:hypothetical protein
VPLRWLLIRDPHGRFDTQALLCTDRTVTPAQIVTWFVLRWQVAVTLEEARRHRGVETPRPWSDRAIQRTTPARLGRFARVTLLAHPEMTSATVVRPAAWYHQSVPTFVDALALVRRHLWGHTLFCTSPVCDDMVEVPRVLVERLADALCYAA